MMRRLFNQTRTLVNNEQGMSFVLVLTMIVVMSVLAVGVIGVTATNVKLSSGERDYQGVYYIAEAGVNVKMEEVRRIVEETYNDPTVITSDIFFSTLESKFHSLEDTLTDFEDSFGNTPEANVTISRINTDGITREYQIVSEGAISNRTRNVVTSFTVKWQDKDENAGDDGDHGGGSPGQPVSPYAIYTEGKMELKGGPTINGPIASAENSFDSNKDSYEVVENPSEEDLPILPDFPTDLELTEDFDGGTINVEGVRSIRIENLDVSNLNITGTGILNIYVENNFVLKNGDQINQSGNREQLNIIVKNKIDKIQNNTIINGNILYSGTEQIDMQGGNLNSLIFAPNANVSLNGGTITGAIIAETVNKISGNFTINHENILFDELASLYPDSEDTDSDEPATSDDLISDTTPIKEGD